MISKIRALAAGLVLGAVLLASPTGRVRGVLRDASGGVAPHAVVTITRSGLEERRSTVSRSDGVYEFADLAPGVWEVSVEAAGFKRATARGVAVHVDETARVDIQLEVGAHSETVEIRAEGPARPDRQAITTIAGSEAIAGLPLNGRQYLDLAALVPGAVPAAPGTQGSGFSAGGIRSQSNVYLLDGVSNIDTQTNQPLNLFRITEAVQEFSVQTGATTPEFGRGAGAQVNVVTKSGTNAWHGSAFEYFRNSALTAADFFTNRAAGPKNALRRNQFGATLGGPVRRDRTFLFASYEGFRQVAPAVSTVLVPSVQQRATVTDAVSRRLLEFWPLPNLAGAPNYIANVHSRDSDDTALVRGDHRAGQRDWISGRWTQYWGESVVPGPTPLSGGNRGPLSQVSGMANVTHVFSSSAVNDLRLGYSRYRTKRSVQDAGFDAGSVITAADGSALPGVPRFAGLPSIAIGGGIAALGSNANFPQGRVSSTFELFENVSAAAGRHSFRWGFHARREDLARALDRASRGSINFANFGDFARGQLNSATLRTGSTQAYWRRHPWDVYWQDEFRARRNLTLTFGARYEAPSAVFEREGHATNFVPGYGPMLAGTNQAIDIDPTARGRAAIVYRTVPFELPRGGVFPDRNNVAPMFGFAYTPGANGRTTIRAGARIAYDDLFNNVPSAMALAAPYSLQTTQTANGTQPGRFAWPVAFNQDVPLAANDGRQGPGTPAVGVLTFQGLDPWLRSAQAYVYHLTVQREVAGVVIEGGYQGSQGRHLGMFVDANQPEVIVRDPSRRGPLAPNEQVFPYRRFGQAQVAKSIGNSQYNGMVVTARRSAARGMAFQASYTLGKSLDYNSSYFGSGNLPGEPGAPIDGRNLRLEHGPSAFDARHRVVAYFTMALPGMRGANAVSRAVFGGWRVSAIAMLQSGSPFTVVYNGPDTSGFNQFNQGGSPNPGNRPNVVKPGPVPQDNGDPDRAIDRSWFGVNGAGQPGTSGRNAYYGPGMQNVNASVAKSLMGGERARAHLRADFFNLLNHTNFANPVADFNHASFGRITQSAGSAVATSIGTSGGPTGGPRIIQLSLRVEF